MRYSPSQFSSKLKGYAIKTDSLLEGYFRFHKEKLQCYDEKGDRVLIHLNDRYDRNIHRILIGFTYDSKKQLFHTGLENIIQTIDIYGQGEETRLKEEPLKTQQTRFLTKILQQLEEKAPPLLISPSLIQPTRYLGELKDNLIGFPDAFRNNFLQATRQGHAYSLDQLTVGFYLKEIGFSPTPGRTVQFATSPDCLSGHHRSHAHHSHG